MAHPTVALALILAFVVAAILGRRKRPLPPGPKGLPIVGNIFDVPKTREWLAYQEWARQYGGSDPLDLPAMFLT